MCDGQINSTEHTKIYNIFDANSSTSLSLPVFQPTVESCIPTKKSKDTAVLYHGSTVAFSGSTHVTKHVLSGVFSQNKVGLNCIQIHNILLIYQPSFVILSHFEFEKMEQLKKRKDKIGDAYI
jgi:hypothetical protein